MDSSGGTKDEPLAGARPPEIPGDQSPVEAGRDSISPVSKAYRSKGAFPFTGTVRSVRFDLDRPWK